MSSWACGVYGSPEATLRTDPVEMLTVYNHERVHSKKLCNRELSVTDSHHELSLEIKLSFGKNKWLGE